jgi:hypothetical protein
MVEKKLDGKPDTEPQTTAKKSDLEVKPDPWPLKPWEATILAVRMKLSSQIC